MEPFCSNESCMYHSIDVEPSRVILELEIDEDTPIILADVHEKGYTTRATLMQNGKPWAKFCDTCMGAINHVNQIDKRVI